MAQGGAGEEEGAQQQAEQADGKVCRCAVLYDGVQCDTPKQVSSFKGFDGELILSRQRLSREALPLAEAEDVSFQVVQKALFLRVRVLFSVPVTFLPRTFSGFESVRETSKKCPPPCRDVPSAYLC